MLRPLPLVLLSLILESFHRLSDLAGDISQRVIVRVLLGLLEDLRHGTNEDPGARNLELVREKLADIGLDDLVGYPCLCIPVHGTSVDAADLLRKLDQLPL